MLWYYVHEDALTYASNANINTVTTIHPKPTAIAIRLEGAALVGMLAFSDNSQCRCSDFFLFFHTTHKIIDISIKADTEKAPITHATKNIGLSHCSGKKLWSWQSESVPCGNTDVAKVVIDSSIKIPIITVASIWRASDFVKTNILLIIEQ